MSLGLGQTVQSGLRNAGDSGGPYRFDSRAIARLLGHGGRIADTADPARYAALFRRIRGQFEARLRYGFVIPVNLMISGIIRHPVYHERRVPQMVPLALFANSNGFWSLRAAVWIVPGDDPAMPEKLEELYGAFDVPLLLLTPGQIDSGYLAREDFERLI